jgi:N utilization substance protein B
MNRGRSLSRRYVVQALYQWQLNQLDDQALDQYFIPDKDRQRIDVDFFTALVRQVVDHSAELDEYIIPVLDRSIAAVDPVELAILRLGVCEFVHHLDVPYRVVINESIELAKRFGAENSHKYINGILDKLAVKLRAAEVGKQTGKAG